MKIVENEFRPQNVNFQIGRRPDVPPTLVAPKPKGSQVSWNIFKIEECCQIWTKRSLILRSKKA